MDVWISFRDICINIYNLDPAHYRSSPGVAFDAMLKLTKVNLQLISEPSLYYFFEA